METIEQLKKKLRDEAEAIVKAGADIRAKIAKLTRDAAAQFHHSAEGLVGLVQAVTEGAIRAANQALPDQAESSLRQVVEGLAEGFRTTAEAVDLTLQEAAAAGKRFAREDLQKVQADLKSLAQLFAETVERLAGGLKSEAAARAGAVKDHARATLQQVRPAFESAFRTLLGDADQLRREAGQAGSAAARAATGTLFTEIGARLTRLGKRLSRR
jgi:hypothetical protein